MLDTTATRLRGSPTSWSKMSPGANPTPNSGSDQNVGMYKSTAVVLQEMHAFAQPTRTRTACADDSQAIVEAG